MKAKMQVLFTPMRQCLYILQNDLDPQCHKFGKTDPYESPYQSVSARVYQTVRGGRNKLRGSRWYPERIFEIFTPVHSAELGAIEDSVRDELDDLYHRIDRSDYFYAPAESIAGRIRNALNVERYEFKQHLF